MMFPHCFNISNDLTLTSFQFLKKNCFKQFSHADIRNSTKPCWAMLVTEPVNIRVKTLSRCFFASESLTWSVSGTAVPSFCSPSVRQKAPIPQTFFWEPCLAMVPIACISHSIKPHKDIHLFSVLGSVGPKIC